MVMDYDRGTVEIKWGTGHMMLILGNSFPANDRWIKKLWKTVSMDYEHRKEISDSILEWLNGEKDFYSDKDFLQKIANAAVSANTSAVEMQPEIDRLIHDSERLKRFIFDIKIMLGTEKRKDERKKLSCLKKKEAENLKVMQKKLKDLKEKQQSYIQTYNMKNCLFNDTKRKTEKIERNIKLIEQLSEGWN